MRADQRELQKLQEHLKCVVALIVELPPAARKLLLGELAEDVCLLCGEDAPCFCASHYDE